MRYVWRFGVWMLAGSALFAFGVAVGRLHERRVRLETREEAAWLAESLCEERAGCSCCGRPCGQCGPCRAAAVLRDETMWED